MEKYYVTTPIYYVNANPHIGHAYTQIAVDAIARFYRSSGKDVFFLTGTDEHGEKVEEASLRAGFGSGREKEFTDSIVVNFKKAWDSLGINYDRFIRTTEPDHKKTVQALILRMKEAGDIYPGKYSGFFCAPCETFWTDTEAADGVCPECSRPVARIEEENYFFRMSKYQKWLVDYINANPRFIRPEFRRNEVLGFLREPLADLCISRPRDRMGWGVEFPADPKYVVYVWFDALINYLSGVGYGTDDGKFKKYWPADVHVIAKDILRHHGVYWPIMLKSAGLALPKTIFAHGWWKIGGEKMSKSKGNIVDPLDVIAKYGVDPFRYFLIKAVNFGQDGVYNEEALAAMYNSDLANDLGNLLNRTLTMVEKYFAGVSPVTPISKPGLEISKPGLEMGDAAAVYADIAAFYEDLALSKVIERVMSLVNRANKYIEESAPWKHSKEGNMDAVKVIVADLLEVLRVASIALYPFMPASCEKMWAQLGLEGSVSSRMASEIGVWRGFPAGVRVRRGEPLFPRMEKNADDAPKNIIR